MANPILSSGVRNNLLTLQQTTAQQGVIQNRLATGKKVNSAIDNPVNYFTALGLNDRSSQLTGLLDGISNGIQTITAASKGIDSITNLVKSLQSTIKQAQADAVANRPKVVSNGTPLGTAAEAALANSSQRDVALNKPLIGTAATATASTPGNLGITAAGAGSTNAIQISAGSTTYKFDLTPTSTVRDLVNGINASGIATASVGNDGLLTVTGTGSSPLTIESGENVTATGVFTATAGDQTKLFGTADNTAATASGTSAVRSTLVQQYNDLRTQIDGLAKDAGFNGINLLGGDQLSITFNEKTGVNKNKLDIQGDTVTAGNLGIMAAQDGVGVGFINIQDDSSLATAADALTNVLSTLRATASSLGSNLSIVQTRQDFTKELANTLTIGADNLVSADSNAEGASLLALNTRQQLSQTALSLANQADQGVLRLFQ
jgi:flagellin